jgi:alpha-glucosidase
MLGTVQNKQNTLNELNKGVTDNWWENAVIYQVYPRSFKDSNGDGEGDLQGVIQELPYLQDLGIDAIWLSPFYKSPNKDGGYDVSDPRDVDPRFGTLADAEELIQRAHESGIKVIFDIVPNHFSSDHVWFKAALASKPSSAERARFHFADGKGENGNQPPNNWESLFNGPAWTRVIEADGKPGQWYLHLFDSSQPDLNWENAEVAKDFERTLHFWLDRGLDGFRIDVAHGLFKSDVKEDHRDPKELTRALRMDLGGMDPEVRKALLSDIPFFGQGQAHEIYRQWRTIFDSYPEKRMAVAEALLYPTSRLADYVRPDELHQVFNFDYMGAEWNASKIIKSVKSSIAELSTVGASPSWVMNNHDSPRVVSRLKSSDRARAFALLTHALPGSVYVYQGEELGMVEGIIPDEVRQDPAFIRSGGKDKGRDGARVPLPWNASAKNFGFSGGNPWLPMHQTLKEYSVDLQNTEVNSFLNLYKMSLTLRKRFLNQENSTQLIWHDAPEGIVHFSRGSEFILLANTTQLPIDIDVKASVMVLLQSQSGASLIGTIVTVAPDTTLWLRKENN